MGTYVQYDNRELDRLADKISRRKAMLSDEPVEYRVGQTCRTTRTDSGASVREHCYRTGQRLCDLQRVGGALLNQAANAAFGPVVIVPTNSQFFEPIAAECIVTENGNPNANRRVRFTAFVIAASPQEPIDNRAPVVGTTAFMWSDHFLPTDYGPRPVQWGVFSVAALTKDLQVFGFNPNGVAVDIEWLIYGNALDHLPAGVKAGEPVQAPRPSPWGRTGAVG